MREDAPRFSLWVLIHLKMYPELSGHFIVLVGEGGGTFQEWVVSDIQS